MFIWRIVNQEQAQTVVDHFASNVVFSPPYCSFGQGKIHDKGELSADIIPGSDAKWNRKFLEFPNFQQKRQSREVDRNFQPNFWKLSTPFDF